MSSTLVSFAQVAENSNQSSNTMFDTANTGGLSPSRTQAPPQLHRLSPMVPGSPGSPQAFPLAASPLHSLCPAAGASPRSQHYQQPLTPQSQVGKHTTSQHCLLNIPMCNISSTLMFTLNLLSIM